MTEILHAWALAPAAIGTCCLAADRRRVRAPELAASLAMIIAMMDAAIWRIVPAVLWAGLLLATAMALAALRSPRRTATNARASRGGMMLPMSLGLVVMAAMLLCMGHSSAADAGTHAHGLSAGALSAATTLGAVVYAATSTAASVRAHTWFDRAQYLTMAASTLLMGAAALL